MFAYQLTNEGNGPSLAEIWHAVNAKRCVPPVHNNRMWKCIDRFLNKENSTAYLQGAVLSTVSY